MREVHAVGVSDRPQKSVRPHYQVFMLALSIYAVAALAFEAVARPVSDVRLILTYGDWLVCTVFLLDFAYSLWRAPDRWRYFRTWGWLDLVSSIPTVDVLRIGRLGRITRIFRVLRGVKATKVVASLVLERRAQSAMLAAALVSIMMVILGSIAILHFETAPEANIKGPDDAIWWSIVTLTTVGYGDRYPVTFEGRLVAVCLMVAGVGLFGTFSGFVASWFLQPTQKAEEGEIALLRRELAELRSLLKQVVRPPES